MNRTFFLKKIQFFKSFSFRVFRIMATSSNATNNDANEKYDLFISYEWGAPRVKLNNFIQSLRKMTKLYECGATLASRNQQRESLPSAGCNAISRSRVCVRIFMLTRAYTTSGMCKRQESQIGKDHFLYHV